MSMQDPTADNGFYRPINGPQGGQAAPGAGLFPRFFVAPVRMGFKSQQEGREIFEDREMVEILVAGNARQEVVREVTENDKRMWPAHYQAFKAGKELATSGTPLEEWPLIGPAQIKMLKALNIRSVEDLAAVNDVDLNNLGPGGRSIRDKAELFLRSAANSAAVSRAIAASEAKDAKIADLEAQLQRLAARVEKQEKKKAGAAAPSEED